MRRIQQRVIDAKACVAVIFFAADVPAHRHDQAGHGDRALRDVLTELENILDALSGPDGDEQLTFAV